MLELYLAGRANGLLMDANLVVMAVLALAALVVCVGATNVYNFMDGINGITAGYSGVVLLSVLMADAQLGVSVDRSLCLVMLLAVVVFAIFNFRPRGKAKCFAGDVGSVGIALILLFMIGQIIVQTGDITWLIFLLVSLGFVWGCGALASYLDCSLVLVHWVYLICALVLLAVVYVLFKKKYYHLHEEYLRGLGR